jgi:hypothetical protein
MRRLPGCGAGPAGRRSGSSYEEQASVADVPDTLVLKRHRDLEGKFRGAIWVRRGVLGVLAAVVVLGLANVFGQRPSTIGADVPAASISLYAPTAVRGGDLWEARFHIVAKRDLKKAILTLDPGWGEGMSINTIEPSPVSETSDNGRFSFELGQIPKGQSFILFKQFQVIPTNVAWHRPQNIELADGNRVLARMQRTITVFP